MLWEHLHWFVFACVLISVLTSFATFSFSKEDIVAIIFGLIGLLAACSLAIGTEAAKRSAKK